MNVDQNGRSGVLELDHNHRLKVPQLIPIRKKVSWKASPRCVGDCANVLLVRVQFAVAVKPDHVESIASLLLLRNASAIIFPSFSDMSFEIFGHVGVVVHLRDVVVGLGLPPVHAIEFQQKAGLSQAVPVILFTDAFHVTGSIRKPLYIELTSLIFVQGTTTPVALGLGRSSIGPVTWLVLG